MEIAIMSYACDAFPHNRKCLSELTGSGRKGGDRRLQRSPKRIARSTSSLHAAMLFASVSKPVLAVEATFAAWRQLYSAPRSLTTMSCKTAVGTSTDFLEDATEDNADDEPEEDDKAVLMA